MVLEDMPKEAAQRCRVRRMDAAQVSLGEAVAEVAECTFGTTGKHRKDCELYLDESQVEMANAYEDYADHRE